ncbi:MAG: transcriptional regulator [wastewater metagenome]|nr:transcriptional regulator [Candidatus Loosdrechtia aerotolerans]
MNKKELEAILAGGETEVIEFKENLNESFYKNIAAFANAEGGFILLGIDKNGQIKGMDSSSRFLEDLTNRIVNKLSVYPDIETYDTKGKRVIMVKVSRSSYPVSYEGRYYERVGNTTREMMPDKLQILFSRGKPWDSLSGEFSLKEIDVQTVQSFVNLAVETNRLSDASLNESPEMLLEKLDLLSEGKPTNGAVLLFWKNPQKYFINLCVRIGRFKTETTIIDDKWLKGNLFQQFEETIATLKQLISVRYEIKGIQREDIWDYPIPVLREAVLNALIHRDYFNVANFILIKVYDDRIWVSNPGGLPEGITVDELKRPHKSYVRNPLIAKVFYLAGYIEHYGSGTVRMMEWMREAGLPEPDFKEEMGGFSVYFHKDIYTEPSLIKMGLNKRQIRAVTYVKDKGKISNKEYQELVNTTKKTASRDMTDLVEKEILEQIGTTGKGTYYILRGQRGHKGDIKGT